MHKFITASLFAGGMLMLAHANAQELYVFTEPASNMPAKSIGAKVTGRFMKATNTSETMQRYSPEIMFGVSRNWMVHLSTGFSNMFTSNIRWESAKLYAKYRFFTNDEVHRHFRMAAFGEAAYSRNGPHFDELNLDGDQSGVQGGIILTQLTNKLALSSTLSVLKVLQEQSKIELANAPKQAFNYTASAGFLVLPVRYTSFRQVNLNIYTELLGQRALDQQKGNVDLAPAIQLIFNSNAKINIGYRFQVAGNMNRAAARGWLVSFERTFLNALK
jgi:hypothetical protein